jgi:hypothetical protein
MMEVARVRQSLTAAPEEPSVPALRPTWNIVRILNLYAAKRAEDHRMIEIPTPAVRAVHNANL